MTNTFNDITNPELRAWNRCAMIFNLAKDRSDEDAAKYAQNFNKAERDEISNMFNRIKEDGYSNVRAAVNRGVQANAG